MAWTVDYTATAKKQLRKLDGQIARHRRFHGRVRRHEEWPAQHGKALTGPMLDAYWRYRVGDCRVILTFKTARFVSW